MPDLPVFWSDSSSLTLTLSLLCPCSGHCLIFCLTLSLSVWVFQILGFIHLSGLLNCWITFRITLVRNLTVNKNSSQIKLKKNCYVLLSCLYAKMHEIWQQCRVHGLGLPDTTQKNRIVWNLSTRMATSEWHSWMWSQITDGRLHFKKVESPTYSECKGLDIVLHANR